MSQLLKSLFLLFFLAGVARGEDLAETYKACLICHSEVELQRGPKIDGLPAWYVKRQLELFRSGFRGQNPTNRSEHLMGGNRGTLLEKIDIRAMADYVASLPPPVHRPVIRGDAELGREIYGHCGTCHGEQGEGKAVIFAPPLRQLEDWYMLDQLRKYKRNLRGARKEDIYSHMMNLSIRQYTDKDFKAVVAYIARDLANPPKKESP